MAYEYNLIISFIDADELPSPNIVEFLIILTLVLILEIANASVI